MIFVDYPRRVRVRRVAGNEVTLGGIVINKVMHEPTEKYIRECEIGTDCRDQFHLAYVCFLQFIVLMKAYQIFGACLDV